MEDVHKDTSITLEDFNRCAGQAVCTDCKTYTKGGKSNSYFSHVTWPLSDMDLVAR